MRTDQVKYKIISGKLGEYSNLLKIYYLNNYDMLLNNKKEYVPENEWMSYMDVVRFFGVEDKLIRFWRYTKRLPACCSEFSSTTARMFGKRKGYKGYQKHDWIFRKSRILQWGVYHGIVRKINIDDPLYKYTHEELMKAVEFYEKHHGPFPDMSEDMPFDQGC